MDSARSRDPGEPYTIMGGGVKKAGEARGGGLIKLAFLSSARCQRVLKGVHRKTRFCLTV